MLRYLGKFSIFALIVSASTWGVTLLSAQEEGPAAKTAPEPKEKTTPAAAASGGPPVAVIAPAAAEPVKIIGPGTRDAWVPLLVRDKESESLAANGAGLAKRLDLVTRHFRYRLRDQSVAELKPQDIAMAYLAVRKLGRIASELELRKETIAFDFQAHTSRHGMVVQKTAEEFRKQPKFDIKKLTTELEAFLVKYNKSEKPIIEKMIENKQFVQAHERITAAEDKLDPYLVWLTAGDRSRYARPFYDLRQRFMAEWNAIRAKEFEEKRIADREEIAKTTIDLPDRIRAAGKSLATRESTDWQGASLSGPASLAAVREEWLELQRLIAAGFAYDAVLPGIGRKSKNLPATIPDVRKLNDAIATAIGEFMVSDAADWPAAEIPERHRKYLDQAASFTALSNREQTASILETALDSIANKSPEYFAQVKAYREVTKELLHWRKLATDAQAAALESDYPQLSARVKTAFQRTKSVTPGTLYMDNAMFEPYEAVGPAIKYRERKLLGTNVSVPHVVMPLDGSGKSMSSGFSQNFDRCWAKIPFAAPVGSLRTTIDLLKTDLYCSEGFSPLSLGAAAAVWKAEHGYFRSVGCEVTGFTILPLGAGKVHPPQGARYAQPLGDVLQDTDRDPVRQLMFVLDCSDAFWVRHDQFVCHLDE